MLTVLHTGDVHLGDLNGPTRDGRNLRREDTLRCMDAVAEYAKAHAPDVSIIAGDLFNRSRVWADTALDDVNDALERFIRPLCEHSGNVVLLFGTDNHDNPRAFEVIRKAAAILPNLYVVTQPSIITLQSSAGQRYQVMAVPGLDKGRLRLFFPGADKETENRNATALINKVIMGLAAQLDHDVPSILTTHYTVSGTLGDNGSTFLAGQDICITPATIDAANVSLACLGHIHRPQRLVCHTPAYYCGCLNQLTFNDEDSDHGFCYHVLDDKGNVSSDFIHTPERRHFTWRMGPEDVETFNLTGEIPAAGFEDRIVRVRYSCTSEQEKALNRAELQKAIMAAGAFHVAEILSEDVEELDARSDMAEHDSPADALESWLEMNDVPAERKAALLELAAPIIKAADDGRDADRHTGAFIPQLIEVTNYRSYTAASFDFSGIHMAMVNGQNGVGKSSLFMDAIVDCLYESTRSEDVGGWVRDGTKSGSITFTFSMGAQQYRVIRTRTKSGRGTLALHRFNEESGSWEDQSDTTMKLTQAKIERLLGMDCNTFCSIALIRQDAYGLFLEADSDRRMEVLSALLGLDIYTRMEDLARTGAREKRREIAAVKERIAILGEQIDRKTALLEEQAAITENVRVTDREVADAESAVREIEQREALRQEVLARLAEKERQVADLNREADIKTAKRAETYATIQEARQIAAGMAEAETAVEELNQARDALAECSEAAAKADAVRAEIEHTEETIRVSREKILRARDEMDALRATLAEKPKVDAATVKLREISEQLRAARERIREMDEARDALKTAQENRAEFLAGYRMGREKLARQIEEAEKSQSRLADSGCPAPESATCIFLSAARQAVSELPELLESRTALDAQYADMMPSFDEAVQRDTDRIAAIGNPQDDLSRLLEEQHECQAMADRAASLAAAASRMEALESSIVESEDTQRKAGDRLVELQTRRQTLLPAANEARRLQTVVAEKQPYVKALEECRVAAGKVSSLTPLLEQMDAEIADTETKLATAEREAAAIRERVPSDNTQDLSSKKAALAELRSRASALMADLGALGAKLQQISEAESQAAELRETAMELAASLDDYATLVQAFGLDGIQYMIIRGVVPEIMRQSNDILAAMTGGRMAVDIRTEKELKSSKQVVNSLEVWISSIQGTTRPYLSHSGGEKVKIALAVTLGLADVKARRAGVQLGMLFIDEPPFLDADGTDAYADALANMAARNPSMRILAISHDPTMKARFPQNIVVSAGEEGSTVSMEM